MPFELFYIHFRPVHFQYKGCFIIPWYIPVFNGNSVDPDQTPRSVASDLGLHCLLMSLLLDARIKWVNGSFQQQIRFNGNCFGNKGYRGHQ